MILQRSMSVILANCVHCSTEFYIVIEDVKPGLVTKTYECSRCWKFNVFEYKLRGDERLQYYKDKDWLDKKYNSEKLTLQQIADICGCTSMTIRDWMIRHELPTRDPGSRIDRK